MEDRTGAPRRGRFAALVFGVLLPLSITGVAAVLGYAFAVYPIWRQMGNLRRIETLGPLISADESERKALLRAYYDDSGLDVKSFENVAWSVKTVMTPFVGYAPAPGHQHNAFIDSHQFRGARRLVTPKPAGVFRVFLVGASTAFSVGASSDERTIGGYMQSLLDRRSDPGRRYEVFTFATPSWSSTHERIAIENRVSDLEPDLVVELTGTADCLYGQYGRNVLWARAFTDNYYWELANIALERAWLRPMRDVQDAKNRVPPEMVAVRLERNVDMAATALSARGARLAVFLQPSILTSKKPPTPRETRLHPVGSWVNFADPDYYRQCANQIGDQMRRAPLSANASFSDLTGLFDHSPGTEEIFVDSFHFGDRGNFAIAKAVTETIH